MDANKDAIFAIGGWVLFGFIAYGLWKGMLLAEYRQGEGRHNFRNEILCWVILILGPAGFIWTMLVFVIAFAASVLTGKFWFGFCIRMPRELWRSSENKTSL